jgi:hypothetical protein
MILLRGPGSHCLWRRNLQHMDARPYVDLIHRPNGECPESKQEQGIMNKHPDATIMATVSEIT